MQAEKFLHLLFPELQAYDAGREHSFVKRRADGPDEGFGKRRDASGEFAGLAGDESVADAKRAAEAEAADAAEAVAVKVADAGEGTPHPILRLLFPELQVYDAGVTYGFAGGKTPVARANPQGYASAMDVMGGLSEGPLPDAHSDKGRHAAEGASSRRRGAHAASGSGDSAAAAAREVSASLSPGYVSSEDRAATLQRGSERSQSWTDAQAREYVKAKALEQSEKRDTTGADGAAAGAAASAGLSAESAADSDGAATSFSQARARRAREGDSDDKHEGNE